MPFRPPATRSIEEDASDAGMPSEGREFHHGREFHDFEEEDAMRSESPFSTSGRSTSPLSPPREKVRFSDEESPSPGLTPIRMPTLQAPSWADWDPATPRGLTAAQIMEEPTVTWDQWSQERVKSGGPLARARAARERRAAFIEEEARLRALAEEEERRRRLAAEEAAENAAYAESIERAKYAPLPNGSTWLEYGGAQIEYLLNFTFVVDVRWLLRFAKQQDRPVLPACQQLPQEARVNLSQLRESRWKWGLPLAVLSYGWAAKRHPDPTGHQLGHLVPVLEAIVKELDKQEMRLEQEGLPKGTIAFGIVWDFLSLPQRGYTGAGYDPDHDDRTAAQVSHFRRGLFQINVWFGHMWVHTFVLDFPMPEGAENMTDYERRGWCIFERCLSSIVKNDYCYLELSRRPASAIDWYDIREACKTSRPLPMAPDAFEAMMREGIANQEASPGSGIVFTNGKDATEVVIPQFKKGFLFLFSEVPHLEYYDLGWLDSDLAVLLQCLEYAQNHGALRKLQYLNLKDNNITDAGALMLTDALSKNVLSGCSEIALSRNQVSAEAMFQVLQAIKRRWLDSTYLIEYMAPIAVLDVSGLGWGNDEIDRLGKALQTCVFRHAGRMRTTEMIVDLKFAQHGLLKVMCKEAGIELKSKLEPKNVGAPRDRAFW